MTGKWDHKIKSSLASPLLTDKLKSLIVYAEWKSLLFKISAFVCFSPSLALHHPKKTHQFSLRHSFKTTHRRIKNCVRRTKNSISLHVLCNHLIRLASEAQLIHTRWNLNLLTSAPRRKLPFKLSGELLKQLLPKRTQPIFWLARESLHTTTNLSSRQYSGFFPCRQITVETFN